MQFTFDIHVPLEINVQSYLTSVRNNPFTFQVAMFDLYTIMNATLSAVPWDYTQNTRYRSRIIQAATFNKTIGDLKKVGIVSQAKNGGLYLSDAAWELRQQSQAPKTSPKINPNNPFGGSTEVKS